MKNPLKTFKLLLTLVALVVLGLATTVAQAEILYDGANTSGVTTDDQYVIDYDDTSTGNINLDFGSAGTRYLRFDTVNSKFLLSNNLDLQSNQLINARVQNVAILTDVPSCAASGDRGKKIYTGAVPIAAVNGVQTLAANTEYICNDTNPALTRWVVSGSGGDASTLNGLSSTDFLRSDATTAYTTGTLTFNAGTTVTFTPTTTVNLPNTTANTFTVNNDAANGDTSTLSFGDGTGQLIWNDTTSTFSTGAANNLTVNGTETSNSLVVNAAGSVNLNNDQVQNLREENVSALPASPTTGRLVFLTTADTTAPGCSVSVPCAANDSYYFNGTKWVKGSADGSSATLEFSPQYHDGVVRPDGSANVGTMTSDTDTTNNRNYYRWTTNNAALQDIDVVADVRLPSDFGSFAATNALQYDIRTSDTVNTNVKMDLSGKDTASVAMTISGTVAGIVGAVANTWQTNSHNITGGTYTAGSRIQLTFHLSALRASGVSRTFDLGNFRLNYVRKSP